MDYNYLPEPQGKKRFTKEMDNDILKYWPIKQKEKLAKAMGMSCRVMRKRYEELTKHETPI